MHSKWLIAYSLLVLISCGDRNPKPVIGIKNKPHPVKEAEKKEEDRYSIFYFARDLNKLNTSRIEVLVKQISGIKEVRRFIRENKEEAGFLTWEDSTGYEIRAGLDKETHFSTHFLFRVNKQNGDLQILEIFSGEMMSLEEWRKAQ